MVNPPIAVFALASLLFVPLSAQAQEEPVWGDIDAPIVHVPEPVGEPEANGESPDASLDGPLLTPPDDLEPAEDLPDIPSNGPKFPDSSLPENGDNPDGQQNKRVNPLDPAQSCNLFCGNRPCEWPEFHGFSPDAQTLGYSVLKCPGQHDSSNKPRRFYHIRSAQGRTGRLALKEKSLDGVRFDRYFKRNRFDYERIAPSSQSPTDYTAELPDGSFLSITMATEKTVVLIITLSSNGDVYYTHKAELPDIYFGMTIDVLISPDHRRIFIIAHLDLQYAVAGWTAAFGLRTGTN